MQVKVLYDNTESQIVMVKTKNANKQDMYCFAECPSPDNPCYHEDWDEDYIKYATKNRLIGFKVIITPAKYPGLTKEQAEHHAKYISDNWFPSWLVDEWIIGDRKKMLYKEFLSCFMKAVRMRKVC